MLLNRHRVVREEQVTTKDTIVPKEIPVEEIAKENNPPVTPEKPPQKPKSKTTKKKTTKK